MEKLLPLLLLSLCLIACSEKEPELDYSVIDGKFYTSEGEIPIGCFAQLMVEVNGDNTIASIYLNWNSLRGCIDANSPYPGGNEKEVGPYTIEEKLDEHQYKLKICQKVGGSIGSYCDKIIVQFANRDYVRKEFVIKNVLVLDKLGEWE